MTIGEVAKRCAYVMCRMGSDTRSRISLCLLAASVCAILGTSVKAEVAIPFDGSWKEQGFLSLSTNDYVLRGRRLDVSSNGTVSLLWRPVDDAHRAAGRARWVWQVTEGVPATDLTVRGEDDRNLAV